MNPIGDHFYTTSPAERDHATANLGYVDEGTMGWVYNQPLPRQRMSLYRLFNDGTVDHFYTLSAAEADQAVINHGYKNEGIACDVLRVGDPNGIPLFRMYHPGTGNHFYTTSETERDNAVLNLGYRDEAVACFVPDSADAQAVPLYRAYHPQANNHFYTTSEAEKNNAVQQLGYHDEGMACYVFPVGLVPTIPLYRSYNPGTGDHFYTTDLNEHSHAVNGSGYQNEGIACYLPAVNQHGTVPCYRSYNPNSSDHFYTTSLAEHQNAVNVIGYRDEGQSFLVFDSPIATPELVPFFRAYKRYGAKVRVLIKIVQMYVFEGVAGQVLPSTAALGTPLLRAFHFQTGDHFYTTSAAEHANAIANLGYQDEGTACRVPDQSLDTTPLYRSFNPNVVDHFYTTSLEEHNHAVQQLGYLDEGTACHVFAIPAVGRRSLHRMWNAETGDHFYTTSVTERDDATLNTGHQTSLNTLFTTMQGIFDQANILVEQGPTEFVSRASFVDVNIGQCTAGNTTDEQNTLFRHRNFAGENDVVIYIVRRTNPPANGCASHPKNKPGAVVANDSTRFTIPHEVGHVLGLDHVNDNTRLMTGNGTANITVAIPVLTAGEINTMNSSKFTIDI